MLKKFKQKVVYHYRIVKKFPSVLEARLAQEVLNLYHVRTVVVRNYLNTRAHFEEGMREIYLLVLPQDYQFAYRLLYNK